MHQKKFLPYTALVIAIAIWGGALPAIQITEQFVPPMLLLMLRFLLVSIVMLPFLHHELKHNPINSKDILKLTMLGLASQSAIAFVFWGVALTSTVDVAIISTISPIMTLAAGAYFYNEKLANKTKLGVLIAALGTLYITLGPVLFAQADETTPVYARLTGNLLIILYNVSFTLYIIWSKSVMGEKSSNLTTVFKAFHIGPMTKKYSPFVVTAYSFFVGLASLIPLAYLEARGSFGAYTFQLANLTKPAPVLGLLYLAFFSSIVAYMLYQWGLKNALVSDGAILGYLGPLFTIPLSFLLINEIPSNVNLLGSVIIAIGVVIAEKTKTKVE